ncbi:hypothetical protein EYF80_022114 [Liparis tanakae]|uniref:Uncharacterized protein n=1 Tax=Liparis tanakae TaxID=230148 RepID=A0A4Z2HPX1_9TELE|nr:hypothetical protein EYF80_022114 [Liparis tanakae]
MDDFPLLLKPMSRILGLLSDADGLSSMSASSSPLQTPNGNSLGDTWRKLVFVKQHLNSGGQTLTDAEALQQEVTDLRLRCAHLADENKDLKSKLEDGGLGLCPDPELESSSDSGVDGRLWPPHESVSELTLSGTVEHLTAPCARHGLFAALAGGGGATGSAAFRAHLGESELPRSLPPSSLLRRGRGNESSASCFGRIGESRHGKRGSVVVEVRLQRGGGAEHLDSAMFCGGGGGGLL